MFTDGLDMLCSRPLHLDGTPVIRVHLREFTCDHDYYYYYYVDESEADGEDMIEDTEEYYDIDMEDTGNNFDNDIEDNWMHYDMDSKNSENEHYYYDEDEGGSTIYTHCHYCANFLFYL